jgi:DNA-directed RNA polymerase sigma subunit (sigma70/sigma32)
MDDQPVRSIADEEFAPGTVADPLSLVEARKLMSALLQERVAARLLSVQDERILVLRLGLEDGYCYTLDETASLMHKSPETVRCRQHLALRKAIKDLHFFKAFRDYAHLVHLPRGVTYYLYKYSEYIDTF